MGLKILLLIYFTTILFCMIASYIKKDPQFMEDFKNEELLILSDPVLISIIGILFIILSF